MYPSRLTGTPSFKINGFATTFTEFTTAAAANQASDPYKEEFKQWRSPNSYNDATIDFEVIVS